MSTVDDWEADGLLDGLSDAARADRIALLTRLHADGFTADAIHRAAERGDLPLLLTDRILSGHGAFTGRQLAERSGLGIDFLSRIRQVSGLPPLELDAPIYADTELASARTGRAFLDLGLSEETILQFARIMGRSLGTLAELARDVLFASIVQEGMTELELADVLAGAAETMVPLMAGLLGQVTRTQLREAVANQLVARSAGAIAGTQQAVIAFADLVGFTRLGEEVPPEELGRVADRFDEMAADVVTSPVRIAKTLGDGVMLVAPEADAPALLTTALALVAAADDEGATFPQVHVGVAAGQALSRAGDWFGAPVNLASRVSDVARAGSVLATRPVRELAPDAVAWSSAGARTFKGVPDPVRLYRARPLEGSVSR